MFKKIPRVYVAVAISIIVLFYVLSNIRRNNDSQTGMSPSRSLRTTTNQKFDVPSRRFAGAETLRNAKSGDLIAEIEKLIQQNGLPADVFADDRQSDERNVDDPTNIAVTLQNLFQEYSKKEPNDLQKLWAASPIGAWDIDEQAFNSVRPTFAKLETKRQVVRKMLNQHATTHFNYIFNRPKLGAFLYVHTKVDTAASQYLADYTLLEEYAIAQALLDENIGAATEALAYIFRIAQLASELGNIGVRSDAALVRLRAFDIMQRVVLDPQFDKAQMIFLRDMLSEQHEHWTSEYEAWFGDRASGIALYHRLMMNGPENALESAEFELMESRWGRNKFMRGFTKYREADEVFYLRSMQKVLDVSNKPFVKRLDVLNQINKGMTDKEDTFDENGISTEHFVAYLLLKDVDRLMRIFAQDQSALNRALVVILRSLGQSNTDNYRDPFTDEPYKVQKVDGLLSISATRLLRPFRVPIFMDKE